ncbi:unnamed protein product [Staurois parvus]|uniref:Uncharacterized protein n=1 Tax=Staurois parvus TaxID=386267 RepID=A0ABN9CTF8_9NEOB|nr:unnamed protein product [Staurois parvus]
MLVILTVVNQLHCVKRTFVFFDPPRLSHSPFHLLIEHSLGDTLHMLSLVCIATEFFLFFLGECM